MIAILYSVATFLSAFLLFVIQPLLAKKLLLWFGSSPNAWLTVILFFQGLLLLGYLYAFCLNRVTSIRFQGIIQITLLLGCGLFIPLELSVPEALHSISPPLAITGVLGLHLFLPILILSSASPLLQSWYCRRTNSQYPFYLYAFSNAGALLGLFSFPFLLEPFFGISLLLKSWSLLLALLMAGFALCFLYSLPKQTQTQPIANTPPLALKRSHIAIWLTVALLSSALLLSSTQLLLQNILSFPLLWIIPLALYLLTYILTFSWPKTGKLGFWLTLFTLSTLLVFILPSHHHLVLRDQVVLYAILIFSGCMICQGALIRYKPDPKYLTHFYLCIALGGVLGGSFVNFLAPLLFIEWWDFYLPLFAILIFGGAELCITRYQNRPRLIATSAWSLVTLSVMGVLLFQLQKTQEGVIYQHRNFFGRCDITENIAANQIAQRTLRHGYIMHGQQYLDENYRQKPTSYFSPQSGIGLAIQYLHQKENPAINAGIVGLGTGTIAALMQAHDIAHFYELDPAVIKLAENWFYYLNDSPATIQMTVSDGRLALQKAADRGQPAGYDLLAIDAFNGDALPTHLITLEALQLYLSHLQPNGILAFNISNRYVDLYPHLLAAAKTLDIHAHLTHNSADPKQGIHAAEWVLFSHDPQLGIFLYQQSALFFRQERQEIVWTDDFNCLLSAIKWRI